MCTSAGSDGACLLPESPSAPTFLQVLTSDSSLGRTIQWKSATGLVSIAASTTVIVDGGTDTGDPKSCSCGRRSPCVGAGGASVVGNATASAGVDVVTATVPGYAAPLLAQRFLVQGPAKLLPSGVTLTNDADVLLSIQNPMGFTEACTFTVPAGVRVGRVDTSVDGGTTDAASTVSWYSACPWAVDGGGPLGADGSAGSDLPSCIVRPEASWTDRTQVFSFSFEPGLTDATASAAGLTSARAITAVCEDQFGQQGTVSIPAQWTVASPVKATDGGSKGED
jgi:hypothetical protein